MSRSEFSRVLDSLKGHTNYIYYHLMGEPLTHPELPEFIEMASERGFRSMITTNGTLLSERGSSLLSSRLHKINISLHSFEGNDSEKHEKYLKSVAEFAEKASDYGIITVLRLWNSGFDSKKNSDVIQFLKSRFTDEWSENNRGFKLREKLFLEFGERFEWPDREADDCGSNISCYGMRDHFGILCDGTVVPCCLDSDGIISLGNIFSENLSDILNSERAQAIKRGFECRKAVEEICRKCGYARRF